MGYLIIHNNRIQTAINKIQKRDFYLQILIGIQLIKLLKLILKNAKNGVI